MSTEYEDLAYFIEEKIKECNINWYAVIASSVAGTIKGAEFSIILKMGKYLSVSVDGGSGIINILQPVLSEFMKCEPLCSYDVVSFDGKTSVMEWYLFGREKRIKELVNANPFDDTKVINLQIFDPTISIKDRPS